MSVSCVITCYNNTEYIGIAIESVIRQTHAVDEIIVSDDASTDGSQDIIRSFADQYGNISAIFRDRNLGISANRDLAMRQARSQSIQPWSA